MSENVSDAARRHIGQHCEDAPVLSGPGTDDETKVCAVCGRVGVRGFTLRQYDQLESTPVYGPTLAARYVVCTREPSCRRRREQGYDEEGHE